MELMDIKLQDMDSGRLTELAQAHVDRTLCDSDLIDLYGLVGELIRSHGYWLNEAERLSVDADELRDENDRLRTLIDQAVEASSDGSGSARDAIQDMLWILSAASDDEQQ